MAPKVPTPKSLPKTAGQTAGAGAKAAAADKVAKTEAKSTSWKDRFGGLFGEKDKATKETTNSMEPVKGKSILSKLKDNTNEVVSKLLKSFTGGEDVDNLNKKSPPTKILKGILKLMVELEAQRKSDDISDLKSSKVEERESEKRHKEVLKALTVRRKPKKTAKQTKKKTETVTKGKTTAGSKGGKATTGKGKASPAAGAGATAAAAGAGASLPTGVLVASTGLLAAASMSVRGETGSADLVKVKGDANKVGQIVPNDPKPGVSSYGVFGMNSGGSVQRFVADNPQFGLTGKPGTSEFDAKWKQVATEKTGDFYNAQLSWYSRYVYEPTKKEMQSKLPGNLGSSDKVVTYMADRRNQMNKIGEDEAIKYAKDAKTPEEFINKIAEHDASSEFIQRAFPTYLANNGLDKIKGLQNRVELRKQLTLNAQIGGSNDGAKIESQSVDNKQLKDSATDQPPANKTITQVNVGGNAPQQKQTKKVDDRTPHDRVREGQ